MPERESVAAETRPVAIRDRRDASDRVTREMGASADRDIEAGARCRIASIPAGPRLLAFGNGGSAAEWCSKSDPR